MEINHCLTNYTSCKGEKEKLSLSMKKKLVTMN